MNSETQNIIDKLSDFSDDTSSQSLDSRMNSPGKGKKKNRFEQSPARSGMN